MGVESNGLNDGFLEVIFGDPEFSNKFNTIVIRLSPVAGSTISVAYW